MLRYSLVRLAQLIVTLFVASVVVFLVIQHAPGDPARMRVGLTATQAQVAAERVKLGLNDSLPERYGIWLGGALHLDLGYSFSTGQPVTTMIASAFGYTLRLSILAIVLGLLIGLPIGTWTALRRGGKVDAIVSSASALALSIPTFALGSLFILVLAVRFKLFPSAGAGQPGQGFFGMLHATLLPAVALALPFAAVLVRYVRTELGDAMDQPYVVTAASLGLHRRTVIYNAWRNSLIPTLTVMGIQAGRLLAGAIFAETVFSYPGLGYLTIQSIQSLDYPVVEGVLLLASAIFLVVMFVVDMLVGVIDPRARLGSR